MAETTTKPPVTATQVDLAKVVAAKRETYLKEFAGKEGHNPFYFLNEKIAPLEVKLSKKENLTDDEKKLVLGEWPAPKI